VSICALFRWDLDGISIDFFAKLLDGVRCWNADDRCQFQVRKVINLGDGVSSSIRHVVVGLGLILDLYCCCVCWQWCEKQ
jgi:hypothetical protein